MCLFQKMHLGDGYGHLIKFWTDPWLNGGRLKDQYGDRAIYDLGLGCDIRLHCSIEAHEWLFPTPTSNALMDIFHEIPLELQPCYDFDDELVWTLADDGIFTLKSAYQM